MIGQENLNHVPEEVVKDVLRRVQSSDSFILNRVAPVIKCSQDYVEVTFGGDYDLGAYAGIDDNVGLRGTVTVPDESPEDPRFYRLRGRGLAGVLDAGKYKANPLGAQRALLSTHLTAMSIQDEIYLSQLLSAGANWTGSIALAAGDKWQDQATNAINNAADPAGVLADMAEALRARGLNADTVVVPSDVMAILNKAPQLASFAAHDRDNNFYDSTRVQQLIAQIFGMDASRVFVAKAVRNTSAQGQVASESAIHSNYIWAGVNLPVDDPDLLSDPNFEIADDMGQSISIPRAIGVLNLQADGYKSVRFRDENTGYGGAWRLRTGKLDLQAKGHASCGIALTGIIQ